MPMKEVYRAGFVSPVTSHTPLAMDTPFAVVKALSHIYPLLVLVDSMLSMLQWSTSDTQLVCVHLLMLCLGLRFLLNPSKIALSSLSVKDVVLDYSGMMCVVFLLCSLSYYIYTVLEQTQVSEPPTVDDIVLLMESIRSKLDTTRNNMLRLVRITTMNELFRWITLATFFQLLVFKFHLFPAVYETRDYIVSCVALAGVYHSQSVQGLLQIIWRMRWVRTLCTWWNGQYDPLRSWQSVSAQQWFAANESQINYITVKLIVNDVEELTKINVLRRKLVELYETKLDDGQGTKTADTPTISFNIMEVKIHENQRKWDQSFWDGTLLPYERSRFCIFTSKSRPVGCESPQMLDATLPETWVSLDQSWLKSDWSYSTTDWKYIGKNDTAECFTRSRIWTKRIFQRCNDK